MNKLKISNIGKIDLRTVLDDYFSQDPFARLDTILVLSNYSSLNMARDYIVDKYKALASSNIISIDDIVDKFKEPGSLYIDKKISTIIIEKILKNLNYNTNLALELGEIILDFKSQNIKPEDLDKTKGMSQDFKDLKIIYRAYEDFLKEKKIRDFIDQYYDGGKRLKELKGKKIIFYGFIEFRSEEWVLIENLKNNNTIEIYYPFMMKKTSIKEKNMVKKLKSLNFNIEEKLDIGTSKEEIAYNFSYNDLEIQGSKNSFKLVSTNSIYSEVKSVLKMIDEDLRELDYTDIAIIIPKEYENTLRILAKEENIELKSLNQNMAKNLIFIGVFVNFLYLIKDQDIQRLVNFYENTLISTFEPTSEDIENLRLLDYGGLDKDYVDIDPDLSLLIKKTEILVDFIKKDPIGNIKVYLEGLDLKAKLLDSYKTSKDLDVFQSATKALDIIDDQIEKLENISHILSLTSEEKIDLLIDLIEEASYYEPTDRQGIEVLTNINAIGRKFEKTYILGLSQDYPASKDRSYFYKDVKIRAYEKIAFDVEEYEDHIDNELIKFIYIFASSNDLVFSYSGEDKSYSKFLRSLNKYVEFEEINGTSLDKNKAISDLIQAKKTLNYLAKAEVEALNNLGLNYQKRQDRDKSLLGGLASFRPNFSSYSARMLSEYNKCPFRFLMAYVNEIGPKDLAYENRWNIEKGNLYHEILRDFYRKNRDTSILSDEMIIEDISSIADQYGQNIKHWQVVGPVVKGILYQFVQSLQGESNILSKKFVPEYLEEKIYKNLGSINIYGLIDRVDMAEDGSLLIYDYKTKSAPPQRSVRNLEELQLGIYSLLVEDCVVGGFYAIIEDPRIVRPFFLDDLITRGRRDGAMSKEDLEGYKISIREKIFEFDERIKGGDYSIDPIDDKVCQYCDYRDICRREVIRGGI